MDDLQAAERRARSDLELTAWIACVAVAIGFGAYWGLQIQDVRELLALAYG